MSLVITLLGTGDATSVPAPLCNCEYCIDSDRRRHPSVLIETDDVGLLLDAGPDLQEQLHEIGVRSADGVFLTHKHGDHTAGLPALYQTAKWDSDHLASIQELQPTPEGFDPGFAIFATPKAHDALTTRYGPWDERLTYRSIEGGETVEINGTDVSAVPIDHHRPDCHTLGFVVDDGDKRICYAPDMRRWHADPPENVDVLICEGAAILGQPVHGPRDELLSAVESVDAERTVLVNVNEHVQQAHTGELQQRASQEGYELGTDFKTYEV